MFTPELEQLFVSCIGRPDPTVLDIGCNDGSDTQSFLSTFPGARMFCFEPDPRAQKRFRSAVLDSRAQLFPMAIGAIDGSVDFWPSDGAPYPKWLHERPDGWDFSGSIRRPKGHVQAHPWCQFKETIKIWSARLDTWSLALQVDRVDFIWADVQGAEVDLIEGGRETLARTRYLYTEYNDGELYEGQVTLSRLLEMLPRFEVVMRFPDDVLLKNKDLT